MDALRHDLLAFAVSALGLAALVGLGEALRRWGRASAETSRSVVHAGVGVFVVCTPYLFAGPALVYALAVVFVGVNAFTLRRGWLRGIHPAGRQSLGTVAFPLALVPALAIGWSADPSRVFALQVAFLILAFSDPLAAWAGRRWGAKTRPILPDKTLAGSAAFFGSALLLSLGALLWFRAEGQLGWSVGEVVAAAGTVAGVATAVEALGRTGWDNFFIVQAVLVVLVVFDAQPQARLVLPAATGAGVVFALAAYRLRVLDATGVIAGGLLAVSVIGLGGWAWAVPSVAFFVLSSMLSRVGRRRKASAEALSEKGSRRDAAQVYANGGVGWALLLLYTVSPAEVFYWGFLGAFAAATADTWATELGTLSARPPRLITTGRRMPRGTSGAVSVVGTLGAVAGALVIGLSAAPFMAGWSLSWTVAALAVVGGGVFGALVDSLAGATVQARFVDPQTGTETERASSAAGAHRLVRGHGWLRNDQVNALCTLTGAAFAMACFQVANFAS